MCSSFFIAEIIILILYFKWRRRRFAAEPLALFSYIEMFMSKRLVPMFDLFWMLSWTSRNRPHWPGRQRLQPLLPLLQQSAQNFDNPLRFEMLSTLPSLQHVLNQPLDRHHPYSSSIRLEKLTGRPHLVDLLSRQHDHSDSGRPSRGRARWRPVLTVSVVLWSICNIGHVHRLDAVVQPLPWSWSGSSDAVVRATGSKMWRFIFIPAMLGGLAVVAGCNSMAVKQYASGAREIIRQFQRSSTRTPLQTVTHCSANPLRIRFHILCKYGHASGAFFCGNVVDLCPETSRNGKLLSELINELSNAERAVSQLYLTLT